MAKEVTLEQFIDNAELFVKEAVNGEHLEIKTGRGLNAVLIDETEWTMLCQALAICSEHPEWMLSDS